ncbi:MAG: S-layer homology domain-containing protein [Firmicutes bacterium]|nr:S-layer homology domain-containing protein [Bacillota bacterium]
MIASIQAGLLPLTEKGALKPDKAITRAEAARMVYKVMERANKL